MDDALRLFRERGPAALWERTLGFLDYDLEQAMDVQRAGMEATLAWLPTVPLGRQLLGDRPPRTIEEFRERVPITGYDPYESTLGQKDDTSIGGAPVSWIRTSGRTRANPKQIPLPQARFDEMNWVTTGIFMLSAARERGDVRLKPGARILNMTAPAPYGSGTIVEAMGTHMWPVRMFPHPDTAGMEFAARMAMAFGRAITEGVDFIGALPSVLAGLGETFGQRKPPGSILDRLKNPRAFARMGRAVATSKFAGRGLYPKDALKPIGIPVGGGDASLFREKIRQYWGVYPLEMFVSSEGLLVGVQGWDKTSLTFCPTLNFLEFIPEDEFMTDAAAAAPVRTVLLDEVEPGKNYEMVITNFFGGPMVRYRTGDIFRITDRTNSLSGVQLPQAVSYGRHSDTIDLAGFVKLTERAVWAAIEEAGVPYVDWVARKEIENSQPTLHVRIEPRPGSPLRSDEAHERINEALKRLEPDWADLETMAGLKPLRVTYLPSDAFDRYVESRRKQGADLGQLKPLHMNATDAALAELVKEDSNVPIGSR